MQGRMFLGEAVTRGAPQLLWTCSMLVLGPENADLARGWSSELVRFSAGSAGLPRITAVTVRSI